MKISKLLVNLFFVAAASAACATDFASSNTSVTEPTVQKQGENITWLKDRLTSIEEKAWTNSVAASEFIVLTQVFLETAQKSASNAATPASMLSQATFFSGNTDCVFESTLARIVNTQGRLQLGLPTSECKGLSIEQIKQIDFAKIDFSGFQ